MRLRGDRGMRSSGGPRRWCWWSVMALCVVEQAQTKPAGGALADVGAAARQDAGRGHGKGSRTRSVGAEALLQAVRTGTLDAVVSALERGADVNLADNKGVTPLYEAAARMDAPTVETLLNYGALLPENYDAINLEPPEPLKHPLIALAARDGVGHATRLLLKFGAKPDAAFDDEGRSARTHMREFPKVARLLAKYDKLGAAAFQDAVGAFTVELGEPQTEEEDAPPALAFRNAAKNTITYRTPPSCGWRVDKNPGQFYRFVNIVTAQRLVVRPPHLCWKYLRGAPNELGLPGFWFNYATNYTSADVPAELASAPDLAAEIYNEGATFWVNRVTGERTWQDPEETNWMFVGDTWFLPNHDSEPVLMDRQPAEAAWSQRVRTDSELEYFNSVTGKVTRRRPKELGWDKLVELFGEYGENSERKGAFSKRWSSRSSGEL